MLLQNRFYLGELPDGHGGWVDGAHEAAARRRPVRGRAGGARAPGDQPAAGATPGEGLLPVGAAAVPPLRRQAPPAPGHAAACAPTATRPGRGPSAPSARPSSTSTRGRCWSTWPPSRSRRTTGEQLVAAQERSKDSAADAAAQRRRLEGQLANLRTLFELGDIDEGGVPGAARAAAATAGRDCKTEAELGAALERAAAFLADLPAAWRAADDAQRNALARLLFQEVRVKDDWVAAVVPQPSFAPFFDWDCQARRLSGGSDGLRSRGCILPPCAMFLAAPPERRRVGKSGRDSYRSSPSRKLSREQEAFIRADAGNLSLRELANRFGVSHETIRSTIRRPATAGFDAPSGRCSGRPAIAVHPARFRNR